MSYCSCCSDQLYDRKYFIVSYEYTNGTTIYEINYCTECATACFDESMLDPFTREVEENSWNWQIHCSYCGETILDIDGFDGTKHLRITSVKLKGTIEILCCDECKKQYIFK